MEKPIQDQTLPMTPEQQQQLRLLQNFFMNNADRIKQWEYAHTPYTINPQTKQVVLGKCTVKLPIIWNPSIGDYYWLNRKARRDLKRGKSAT